VVRNVLALESFSVFLEEILGGRSPGWQLDIVYSLAV
jgi:hypothetical protein